MKPIFMFSYAFFHFCPIKKLKETKVITKFQSNTKEIENSMAVCVFLLLGD